MDTIGSIYSGLHSKAKNVPIKPYSGDLNGHHQIILNIARGIHPSFKITEENRRIINLFFYYFTGNKKFPDLMQKITKSKGSLSKGLMLVGGIGSGKSLLFDIFKTYSRECLKINSFQTITALDIIDEVSVLGINCLEKFSHNKSNGKPRPITFYIDDIASKNENINHFGTNLHVIEHLLNYRYNTFLRYGTLTHISTNIYPKQMKNIYDARTNDRMKEMFNIIELDGESWRK
jgi:hypothetical protein